MSVVGTSMGHFLRTWRLRLQRPVTMERVQAYFQRKLPAPRHPGLAGGAAVAADANRYDHIYSRWIAARVARRRDIYRAQPQPGLFSIITPVYDTPERFLREAAQSVFGQDFPFEWCLCDNGSSAPGTRAALADIARDARVKIVRLEQNAGIMGGMNAALQLAAGRYVLPVDSDDLLYPDALRVMAACLARAGWPALAYSDEDKIHAESVACSPFFKPAWDPILFFNCCYVAHLCAVDRAEAIRCGAYADFAARGCHDWDSFTRLIAAGHTPLHVPEVLYSWRIHAGSTASPSSTAKSYTLECQRHVLGNFLAHQPNGGRFEMEPNMLFGHEGMWRVARRHVDPRPIHVLCFPGAISAHDAANGPLTQLRQLVAGLDDEALVGLMAEGTRIVSAGWEWEACGVFDLHPDVVGCTPRVMSPDGRLADAGGCFGFDGIAGSPDRGRPRADSGYYGWVFCSRTVSVAAGEMSVWSAGFLRAALPRIEERASGQSLALWLSAEAAMVAHRIAYVPQIEITRANSASDVRLPNPTERTEFVRRYPRLPWMEAQYSRFLDLRRRRGYALALPAERAKALRQWPDRSDGTQTGTASHYGDAETYWEPHASPASAKPDA